MNICHVLFPGMIRAEGHMTLSNKATGVGSLKFPEMKQSRRLEIQLSSLFYANVFSPRPVGFKSTVFVELSSSLNSGNSGQ